jgi:signal transduction histidine kinase/HAMP domain-containing protein
MKWIETLKAGWRKAFRHWTRRILAQKWADVGLRGKMSALVTVGMVGLIAIFSYMAILSVRQTTQQLLDEHVLKARILAENLDSSISHIAGVLTILSSELDMAEPQGSLDRWGDTFERDFPPVRGIYLLDANQRLVASTSDALEIDWKDALPQNAEGGESERIISTEGLPRPYTVVAIPVGGENSQTSMLMAALLDLSDPNIFLSSGSLDIASGEYMQILDAKGRVLVSSDPTATLTSDVIDKITTQLAASDQPTFEACIGCASNGLESGTVITFASVAQTQWGVLLWHDSQDLFAPVRIIGIRTLGLGLVAILGALGLVLLTTRSVIAPVQALTDAAHKIGGDGQLDRSTLEEVKCTLSTTLAKEAIRRRDEIGVLSKSFISMCTRLQQSLDEIQNWNRELDARVRVRTKELSILNAVALTVNQSLNLDEILNRALDEVIQLAEIDVIAIFIQNAARGKLELQAYRGLSKEAAQLAYQVGLLDGSCGGVMELGRTVVVPDISSHRGRGARSLQREHIASIVHVPLMTKGCALGSMCVGTRTTATFDEEEQDLLAAIGNQIAIAVENARLYADVQRRERVRGELFKKTLAAQEDERKRIARELHDDISQSLTALLYDAEGGLEVKQLANIKKRLQSICDLSQTTLENVHKLIFDLRPSMLDQLGLVPALRWLTETRLESKGVRVKVTANTKNASPGCANDSHLLSPEVETALYRVIQEAINNIARHSAARNVEIGLQCNNGVVSVNIVDDGIGFDVSEVSEGALMEIDDEGNPLPVNTRGLGLLGMQERILLLEGEIDIVSTPGKGTQISIKVPTEIRSMAYDQSTGG